MVVIEEMKVNKQKELKNKQTDLSLMESSSEQAINNGASQEQLTQLYNDLLISIEMLETELQTL